MTHTFNRTWSNGSASVPARIAVEGEGETNLDATIPANASAQELDFVMDVSELKGLFLFCSQACTIKTNNSGSPVNTFTLAAGIPFVWVFGDPAIHDTANAAVTTDITKLYVVNPDAANAITLKIRSLYDPTV